MPENIIVNWGLPLAAFIIMFSMGLGLTQKDFYRIFETPKNYLIGAFLQIITLPLIAFSLVVFWNISGPLAVGFLILAACPGGTTSNILTYIARGDTALSISLTASISMVSFLTLPLIVGGALSYFIDVQSQELPIARTLIGVCLLTLVPTVLGMFVKYKAPKTSILLEKVFRILAMIFFLAIVSLAILVNREKLTIYFEQVGVPVIIFNLLVLSVALITAHLFIHGNRQKIAIVIECGLQNTSLAIAIAGTMLGDITMAVPSAIYAIFMLISGLMIIFLFERKRINS